jgi:DNA uptake protein ComE-like DNA-binding protein
MNFFKSYFNYNKRQRNGILFLLIIIFGLQLVFFFVDFSLNEHLDLTNLEIKKFEKELDSLKKAKLANKKNQIYLFNPNYISDYKGYQLGMSVEEIDKLHRFRQEGNFINSVEQFQKVTKISDSLLTKISPYFKFPSWVNKKQSKPKVHSINNQVKPLVKKDLNLATITDLRIVNGIGESYANRIINYRTKLQGFSFNEQLYEVWNLDKELSSKVLAYFEVVEKPPIKKINVNTATFKQILSVVYIDYELTKKIINYREEVAEIQGIDELKKIEGFPIEKFERIALYLVAE